MLKFDNEAKTIYANGVDLKPTPEEFKWATMEIKVGDMVAVWRWALRRYNKLLGK